MNIKKQLATGLTVVTMFGATALPVSVFANESATISSLTDKVIAEVGDKEYRKDDGEVIRGEQIIKADSQGKPVIDDYNLDELSNKDSIRFLTDVQKVTDEAAIEGDKAIARGEAEGSTINSKTSSKFWEYMSDYNSVGARMIASTTQGYRPDFISANSLLRPIMPVYNTLTAVFLILAFFGLFLFPAIDLWYFNTPPLQYASVEMSDNKLIKATLSVVSPQAKKAVDDTYKDGKSPLFRWARGIIGRLIICGIMLLYFATNSALAITGPFVNLLSNLLF